MSEKSSGAGATKSKASSKSKSADAKSPASDAKPVASDKTESAKSAGDAGGGADSDTKKPGKSSEEKSQKQTASPSDVHYGYFSSVRTPAYRKGWDDIFGKGKSAGKRVGKNDATAAPKKKKAAIKKPIMLELDIGELPEELRTALGAEVRRKIKRRRVNYDKRNAAGAVRWNIVCEIER